MDKTDRQLLRPRQGAARMVGFLLRGRAWRQLDKHTEIEVDEGNDVVLAVNGERLMWLTEEGNIVLDLCGVHDRPVYRKYINLWLPHHLAIRRIRGRTYLVGVSLALVPLSGERRTVDWYGNPIDF